MYNNLVESCFDKCVMVGWGGVNLSFLFYHLILIDVLKELHIKTAVRTGGEVYHTML
jgi:hypothetical protein